MRKTTWAGVFLLTILITGGFILYFGSESMNREGTSNQESEITMKDTEEVAEIIKYIKDKFSGNDRIKDVHFDRNRKAIAVNTSFTRSDLEEGIKFEIEIVDELQLYNKSGERISYMIEINFSDGTLFSSVVILN
ncbi:hypothetical protein DXT76_16875 [Halobacillus trueperi]|uniref:Uncharacterized protein n=1 Tax=Halobacillus trueperi TaxID=156205 RepID=A0A3D8VIE9_9BACI|nr:hypothetical protein [Halobacillus trueperi]RDY69126.1 hypothetical protein DXT76_16875 [Halobacillus trueperi]